MTPGESPRTARQTASAYAMLAPSLLLFLVFIGLPMVLAFVIAFKRIDLSAGVLASPFVGFQNFRDLFANRLLRDHILHAFQNTALFTICFVPVNLMISLLVASLIHAVKGRAKSFYRAAFYLPTVTSAIIFAMIWKWIYDPNYGLLNTVVGWFGHGPINWTGDTEWAMRSVIIAALGAGPGGNVLIYLAALGSVPEDLNEAARVDGANFLLRWWTVTVPALKPVTLYLIVLNTIGSFQVFDLVFVLTNGGPAGSSTVLVYEIYSLAFIKGRYGVAGALSLVLLVLVTALTAVQFFVFGRDTTATVKEGAVGRLMDRIGEAVGRGLSVVGDLIEGVSKKVMARGAGGAGEITASRKHVVARGSSPLGRLLKEAPVHALLLPFALLFLFPMVWMFLSALTPRIYLQSSPPQISWQNFSLENYKRLLEMAPSLGRWFWNSLYLSTLIMSAQVLLSCLAGYVFSRLSFPGRKSLFALYISSIIIPGQSLLIPMFIVISSGIRNFLHIDLLNTHWALILPALCSPVGVFMMRQFIDGIPRELDEAARIDGCGEFTTWRAVILPLCRPVLAAWGILTFTGVWRSFFWPFVVLGSEKLFTLEVGLQTLQQQNIADFGLVMAGATTSAIPMIIVFLIFQKHIVSGLTFGAVKG